MKKEAVSRAGGLKVLSGPLASCMSLSGYSSSSGSLTTGGSSDSVSLSSSPIIIIVIVGISRRHRVAHEGDESPLGRGKVLRDALGHVGSLWLPGIE